MSTPRIPLTAAVQGSSDLRRAARREAAGYLAALGLPRPTQGLLPWSRALAEAETAQQVHVLTDSVTGSPEGVALFVRDFLHAAGSWCDDHGQPDLGDRYRRVGDLFDVADRLLFRLGLDLLAATHPLPPPRQPSS